MPNQKRYGVLLLILVLLALSLPMMTAAAQSDPTPTPAPLTEVTAEPETTQEAVQLPGSDRIDPIDGGAISIGDTIDGTLTDSEPAFVYTLSGEANETVRISLISEDFDPYLVLQDADGHLIDTDDDSAGNFDSRITIVLPAAGDYRIIAQSFAYYNNSGAATGAYTLSVETVETRRIEYTQEITAELTTAELAADYQFTGEAGDSVVIRLNSPIFDTYLTLLDDSGFDLMSNDDSGGTLNSQIGPYELPYTGAYTIQVNSFSRSATGEYTLSVDKVALEPIAYGDVVELEITERGGTFFYSFEGNMGEVVNIYAEGTGVVDTDLALTDPYNYTLISDQNSGRRNDPEIVDYVLTSTGTHTIVLDVVSGTGSVKLSLERGILPSLDEGAQEVVFTSDGSNPTRSLTFTGVAGTVVTLNLAVDTQGANGSPNINVMQQGSTLASGSGSYVGGLSLQFTIQSDGEVLVSFTDYSYTDLTYTVTLETASE